MAKKNYLSKGEQRVWELISDKEIIDNELIRQIFPEWQSNKVLFNLCKKGYLHRARRDLYYNPRILDAEKLGLRIHEGYLGLSSALKYHGLLDYEDFTIFVMTRDFQKKMALPGTQYSINYIPLNGLFRGYVKEEIYVSSLEKTFFDCFLKPGYVGFSILTQGLYNTTLNWRKFVEFYTLTRNNSICQRTGYVLDLMKKKTKYKVPEFVFDTLQKRVKTPVKLISAKGQSVFNKKWKIQDNLGEENIFGWYQ